MQDGARGGTYTSHNHIEIASQGVRGADPGRPDPPLGVYVQRLDARFISEK